MPAAWSYRFWGPLGTIIRRSYRLLVIFNENMICLAKNAFFKFRMSFFMVISIETAWVTNKLEKHVSHVNFLKTSFPYSSQKLKNNEFSKMYPMLILKHEASTNPVKDFLSKLVLSALCCVLPYAAERANLAYLDLSVPALPTFWTTLSQLTKFHPSRSLHRQKPRAEAVTLKS